MVDSAYGRLRSRAYKVKVPNAAHRRSDASSAGDEDQSIGDTSTLTAFSTESGGGASSSLALSAGRGMGNGSLHSFSGTSSTHMVSPHSKRLKGLSNPRLRREKAGAKRGGRVSIVAEMAAKASLTPGPGSFEIDVPGSTPGERD